jgi:hypothetical protein
MGYWDVAVAQIAKAASSTTVCRRYGWTLGPMAAWVDKPDADFKDVILSKQFKPLNGRSYLLLHPLTPHSAAIFCFAHSPAQSALDLNGNETLEQHLQSYVVES